MGIHAPNRTEIQSGQRQAWHNIYRTPWDVLVGLSYVDGVELVLHAGFLDSLTAVAGEVALDNNDSTRAEKELATAGESIYLVSTSASDITNVKVDGINSNGDCETAVITLTGTTPVQVTNGEDDNGWKNINRMFNVGTDAFVGTVFCSTKSDAGTPANTDNIQCKMEVETEYASNPMVMCGNNEVLVFAGIDLSVTQRDEIHIHIHRRLSNAQPWIKVFRLFAFESFIPYRFLVPIVITEGQKIFFSGEATTTTTDVTWQSSYYSMQRDAVVDGGDGISVFFN